MRHRWAWGAARVVDFLLSDAALAPLVDPKKIMTMGHSRGGKTALWHGALDERVSITFPLMSGTGGCGAMRVPTKYQVDGLSQSVSNIVHGFPHWFGSRFGDFGNGNEPHAPWDQHWQRMLVAPRAQMSMEGVNNTHENPVGSQATYTAARTIYDW